MPRTALGLLCPGHCAGRPERALSLHHELGGDGYSYGTDEFSEKKEFRKRSTEQRTKDPPGGESYNKGGYISWQSQGLLSQSWPCWTYHCSGRNLPLICVGGKQRDGIRSKGARGYGQRKDRHEDLDRQFQSILLMHLAQRIPELGLFAIAF